jgi:hypothetical protein
MSLSTSLANAVALLGLPIVGFGGTIGLFLGIVKVAEMLNWKKLKEHQWYAGRDMFVGFAVAPIVALVGTLSGAFLHFAWGTAWSTVYMIQLSLSLGGAAYVILQ